MIVIRVLPKKRHELELNLLKSPHHEPEKYYLTLKEEKGALRPARFRSSTQLLQPKSASRMLKGQRVYISRDEKTEEIGDRLGEMLSHLGARHAWASLCRYCFFENRVTPLPSDFFLSHGEKICYRCAETEVKKEAIARNIKFPIRPILLRLRSVEKVVALLAGTLTLTEENTLYDTISSHEEKSRMRVSELPISDMQKEVLGKEGIDTLMPVQVMAIRNGLLEGKNLLIISATASGKTLIGELAGIRAVLRKKKFLFLVPLVALANQKYEDFRRRYPCRVSIRVGMSRIKTREELVVTDTDIDADIIVGTYEGIDFLLRSGERLEDVGCIVIDEIHTLKDPERGGRLDSLVARLRVLYQSSQFLFLSATVGNPEVIGREMKVTPLVYDKRPIPLERHLILMPSKKDALETIVREEWRTISPFGYHGQSLVFSNSRRKCEYLANHLKSKGINAEAYHAGLPYYLRKRIEENFWHQRIQAVVTTAALSAGVDFPASCVIFESMGMGISPLSVSEFHQMLGRAGRPGFHEKGKVYLLVDPQTSHSKESEDEIATHLLRGKVEDLTVELDGEGELECALACFASGVRIRDANEYSLWTLDESQEKKLEANGLVRNGNVVPLGRAVSMSFLSSKESFALKKCVQNGGDLISIIVSLIPFENVYLTQRLKVLLKLKAERLFSGGALDVFYDPKSYIPLLPKPLWDRLLKLQIEFFSCGCKDSPFCDCGMHTISKRIIELRMRGLSPSQISRHFAKTYSVMVYSGDVFSYLDEVVHKLEAVERIAGVLRREEALHIAQTMKKEIEG